MMILNSGLLFGPPCIGGPSLGSWLGWMACEWWRDTAKTKPW